jgi:hypothetical protein
VSTDLTDAVDPTHALSAQALVRVREQFAVARARVAAWEPRPYPSR